MKIRYMILIPILLVNSLLFSLDIEREIIRKGSALIGTPYRYGGTTPSGFDCSGLVNYLYKPHVPALPRSARDIARYGTTIPLREIEPGDLVFYATGSNRNEITHVGIYIGQNTLIQAVSAGPERGVILTDLDEEYWAQRFKWIKRVLPRVLKAEVQDVTRQFSRGTYEGEVENHEPQGQGEMTMNNGDVYEGEFQEGLFHGEGEYLYSNGDKYVGHFEEGRETGGVLIHSDGSRYDAFRNEDGTLYIARRADRSNKRTNQLLEVPNTWDSWLEEDKKNFDQRREDEQSRFEDWKNNGL